MSIHLSKLIADVHKYQRSVDDAFEKAVDIRSVELLLSPKSLKKHPKQSGDALSPRNGLSSDALTLLKDHAANKTKLSSDERQLLEEVQGGETSLPDVLVKVRTEDGRLGRLLNVVRELAELQLRQKQVERIGLKAYHAHTVWEFLEHELTVRGIPCNEDQLSEYAALVGLGAVSGPGDVISFISRKHDDGLTEELLAEICEKYPDDAVEMGLTVPAHEDKKDAQPRIPQEYTRSIGSGGRARSILDFLWKNRETTIKALAKSVWDGEFLEDASVEMAIDRLAANLTNHPEITIQRNGELIYFNVGQK
jgi:hypothetical protein